MKCKIYAPQVMKYNTTRIENVLQTLKMHTHTPPHLAAHVVPIRFLSFTGVLAPVLDQIHQRRISGKEAFIICIECRARLLWHDDE
jgi:hypothetical protein